MKGYTLAHEHITIDLSGVKNDQDCHLDNQALTIEQLKKLYDYGVRNIIDVTNIGMGRDNDYVDVVSKATNINIVKSTGFYKEPFLPDFFYEKSESELANLMVDELNDFAHVIGEIGTSKNTWSEAEKKLFRAAVLAHKETGAPISTHTTLGTLGLEQAEFFLDNNVDPDMVVIGHLDLSGSLEHIEKIIKLGFNVGFDTIAKDNYFPDTGRIEYLLSLQDKDLIDKVVLSLDITRKSHLATYGYTHIFEKFIPACLDAGITQESIDQMLEGNPNRIYA